MLYVCHFVVLLLPLLGSATDDRDAPVSSGADRVIVKTIAPDPVTGRIVAFSLADGMVLEGEADGSVRLPTDEIVRVSTGGSQRERSDEDTVVTLGTGDMIRGTIQGGGDEKVTLLTMDLGAVDIPLEAIAKIDWPMSFTADHRRVVRWLDRQLVARQDRILLTNGDVVDGFIAAIGPDGVTIDTESGEAAVSRRQVLALRMAFGGAADVEGLHAIVSLRDTGRVTMTSLTWRNGTIEVELQHGSRASFSPDRLVRIDICGGNWEWLSGQEPISYQHTPLLARSWEYVSDRNVLGRPLSVADERYEHGIGVHSRSSLTYDLKGEYNTFVTHFGMDDESGPMADVSVAILVDGKPRFSQENVKRDELHGPVRLDVRRANRIELVVDFGENGDMQDRFDWVEAALIR